MKFKDNMFLFNWREDTEGVHMNHQNFINKNIVQLDQLRLVIKEMMI